MSDSRKMNDEPAVEESPAACMRAVSDLRLCGQDVVEGMAGAIATYDIWILVVVSNETLGKDLAMMSRCR